MRRRLIRQGNETRFYFGDAETQKTKTSGKLESLRSRRSWIEKQRLAEPFRFWLMRVAEDADIWMFTLQERPPLFRHLPAFVQNMTDGDAAACQFDHGLGRKSSLLIIVDVAGDGMATRYSDITE